MSPSFPDFSGQTLDNGRYQLFETLGAGAYGKVYKARDNLSPKGHFAIKCLIKPEPGSRQDLFQAREFALHKLVSDHGNIVTFHRHFSDTDYVYVVLDLCNGGDLFGAIIEGTKFRGNDELVKATLVQLIDALAFCHDKHGVFHRDLKPENILFTKDNKVLLADFGLSTQTKISTGFGCGSSFYMSPECFGQDYGRKPFDTARSDVWAIGIILSNMICGRNPWNRALMSDPCYAAFRADRNLLYGVLPISKGANALFKRIFTADPLDRPSLSELRQHVLNTDTFFKTKKEIARMPVYRQPRVPVDSFKGESTSSAGPGPGDSEEAILFAPGREAELEAQRRAQQLLAASSLASTTSSSSESDSSVSEFNGPITPPTHAVELAVEISEMVEGEYLGEAIIPKVTIQYQPAPKASRFRAARHRGPSNASDRPPPRRSDFFRKAVNLLKAISGSVSS